MTRLVKLSFKPVGHDQSLTPLQIGLGVQIHHLFGSRNLIDQLFAFGYCASYNYVLSFVKNVAVAWKPESFGFGSGCFVQFAADNADNNNCTIDGKDTFHAMGMIAAVTPASKYE